MIVHVRLDERLIHGQVATSWIRYYDANAVVIPSDIIATSDIDKMALRLAASMIADLKLSIVCIKDAIRILNDPRCKPLKIMVVCRTPQDVLCIVQNVPEIPEINLANYGDQIKKDATIVRSLGALKSLRLREEDVEYVRQILALGIPCWVQKAVEERKTILSLDMLNND